MIRDLYINEELMIFLNKNNRLDALKIREKVPKVISQSEIEFIKEKAYIMDELKEGKIVNITTDGTTITSDIVGTKGKGLSIPSSIEDLEFNLNAKRR